VIRKVQKVHLIEKVAKLKRKMKKYQDKHHPTLQLIKSNKKKEMPKKKKKKN
jgi:hypothetical protein